jgi:hypothetical protein
VRFLRSGLLACTTMNFALTTAFLLSLQSTDLAEPAPRRALRRAPDPALLLIGTPGVRQVTIPGVAGRFALDGFDVDRPRPGQSLSARLYQLRYGARPAGLDALHYQVLTRDPRSGALALSDLMRLPLGSDAEAAAVVRTAPAHGPMDASEISYPTVASIQITLNSEPVHTLWTRELSFFDHLGVKKRVSVDFARSSGLTWNGTVDATNLATLQSLADVGNRSHWDDLRLENNGGTTTLDIARLTVILHYEKGSQYEEDIPIVDRTLNRTLAAGTASIDLDSYALGTRKAFAGITPTMHQVVQLAAADFGKSGSDGSDGYGSNPKFNGADNNLCSEFVSWYLHEAGVVMAGEDFRDITATAQIDAAFHNAGRRYDYHNGYQDWILAGGTARYTPQPGDFLARRYGGEYEHAMIVLEWDDAAKVMTVINGPWPVTLRYVSIQDLEESGYDFRVGRLR